MDHRDDALRYPVLIVTPHVDDYKKRRAGGGQPRTFGSKEVSQEMLLQSCASIKADLNQLEHRTIGIARLKLRDEALAKSHRPVEAFTNETCPVIADLEEPGEMLVLVSQKGLDRLSQKIRSLGDTGVAHLTSIESFSLLEKERRFPQRVRSAILERLQETGKARLKIRIPGSHLLAPAFLEELYEQKTALQLTLTEMGVEEKLYLRRGCFEVYAIQIDTIEQAISLASLSFVDKLELMPMYMVNGSLVFNLASLQININEPLQNLPVVAIVDSGIDKNSPLESLVCGREMYVSLAEYDPSHGTSVAALAAALGGELKETLTPRCRLLDIVAMPGGKKIEEDTLIDRIEAAVTRYGSEVKQWNLSLAADPRTQPSTEFSDFATKLDELAKIYGVMFCCAAGNIASSYRNCWPPDPTYQERWISSPGDAVCGITVGSCTNDDTPDNALAPKGAPSPFSPRGPVANNIIKPDLLEVGGNIAGDGKTQLGVNTIGKGGNPVYPVGTSFAAPRVSGMSAEIQACIERSGLKNMKPYLPTKALLLHHAKIPETFVLGGNITMSDYYGFGIPSSMQDTIGDCFWRSTTLIYGQLYPNGEDLVIDDFPYPDGLHGGSNYWGQVWITMVSDPILDASFKTEYVRSNVDIQFGSVQGGKFKGQTNCVHTGERDERTLLRERHKWSPIKQYRSSWREGCSGDALRLKASLTLREKESEFIRTKIKSVQDYPVDFVIAITIADPLKAVQVNNQVFQKWRMRGYIPTPVEVTTQLRARFMPNF